MFEKLKGSKTLKTICPECGEKAVVPVQYGMPGRDMTEAARRDEIIIGGCIVSPTNPRRGCTSCGWREPVSRDSLLRSMFGLDENESTDP